MILGGGVQEASAFEIPALKIHIAEVHEPGVIAALLEVACEPLPIQSAPVRNGEMLRSEMTLVIHQQSDVFHALSRCPVYRSTLLKRLGPWRRARCAPSSRRKAERDARPEATKCRNNPCHPFAPRQSSDRNLPTFPCRTLRGGTAGEFSDNRTP